MLRISIVLIQFIKIALLTIINTKVRSFVNLNNSLVYTENRVKIQNIGNESIGVYKYIIEEPSHFFIEFFNENDIELNYYKNEEKSLMVVLDKTLGPKDKYEFITKIYHLKKFLNKIQTKLLNEDQLVSYKSNLFYYSIYYTIDYEVSYNFKSHTLIETNQESNNKSDNHLIYYYSNIEPFTMNQIEIILVNNGAFLTITNLKRHIFISHFGKIHVEDQIFIKNEGAKLVGPFESSFLANYKASSDWFYTYLPPSVDGIKYFDAIGTNSKMHISKHEDYTILKFKTRYPLLGGWKTFYHLHYNFPLYEYLLTDNNGHFRLDYHILDNLIVDKVVENVLIEIRLPEGASIIDVKTPESFDLKMLTNWDGFTYSGHPTVVLNGSFCIENSLESVEINYLFNEINSYNVVLLIVIYLQFIYCFVIIVRKLQ